MNTKQKLFSVIFDHRIAHGSVFYILSAESVEHAMQKFIKHLYLDDFEDIDIIKELKWSEELECFRDICDNYNVTIFEVKSFKGNIEKLPVTLIGSYFEE